MKVVVLILLCVSWCLADSPPIIDEPEEDRCNPPLWHGELGENWPLAGISRKTAPKFRLVIKGLNGTKYKPGKRHNVVVQVEGRIKKTAERIHGFLLTQETDSESCGLGVFLRKKGKKVTAVTARPECHDMYLDGSTDLAKTRGLQWKAPKCGCVTISVEIRAKGNVMYYDDPDSELEDRYNVLTQTVCPESSE